MKAELKFNKIKHFLDKRGFKYEEMHEKKSNSYILYLSQYELCIVFLSRKNVSFINKIKIPNVVVIHRGNTQKEFFAKVKDALIKGMTEQQEEYMKLQEGL
jgi:hypothetical protein